MKLSLFKIGLLISLIGVTWVTSIYLENEKIIEEFDLLSGQTISVVESFENSGIGYFQVTMPKFASDSLFIQLVDSDSNVITDKKIETKKAVNYFSYSKTGDYMLKITNLSGKTVLVHIEYGDTNVSEIRNPGIIVLGGILLMIFSSFRKLLNYKMAQPSEKIS